MKGEFEFIDDIRRMFADISAPCCIPETGGDCILGMGDDCAVTRQESGYVTLTSTDMLVEGTHFLRSDITPYQLGWKSAAVNFSDIAAMGGIPVGSYLALALPADLPDGWTDDFLKGYHDISQMYSFPLLGGDTTASQNGIAICVTVQGKALQNNKLQNNKPKESGAQGDEIQAASAAGYRLRSAAQIGDLVCVTGPLGDSAAGLEAILKGLPREANATLIERHYLPRPRIAEGMELAASKGVHAMMDISDGIGSDLLHIIEESNARSTNGHDTDTIPDTGTKAATNTIPDTGTKAGIGGIGIEIDLPRLPISDELRKFCTEYGYDPLRFAAAGGEDYELLFTVDPAAEPSLSVPHHVIGRIIEYPAPAAAGNGPGTENSDTATTPGKTSGKMPAPAIQWKDKEGMTIFDCDYCGYRHF